MAIATGLSVPVFNVLKYFFMIVFIETIARSALKNVHLFVRKFDLYKGKGSPLFVSRIDRYNLLHFKGKRSCVRAAFWALLVFCFYVVEIMFEFSSDAVRQENVVPRQRLVYNASYSACEPVDVMEGFVSTSMADMARSCVHLTENGYTLYRPVWVKEESRATQTALCAKTPQNVLQKGQRIYKDRRFTEGTPAWEAVADLIAALRADAWLSNRNSDKALVVISISSSDILVAKSLNPVQQSHRVGHLLVRITSRPAFCIGYISGVVGDGVMKVRMHACIENSTTGFHYLQVYGTAAVFMDAEVMQSESWRIEVVTYFGVAIRNFTSGVFTFDDYYSFKKLFAYVGMLGAASGKDSDSLNKYAVVFKHCNLIKVAQAWDNVRWQEVKFADVREKITVSISVWALSIVVCWSCTFWVVARLLLSIAARRGMPGIVDDETDIARRWGAMERTNQGLAEANQAQKALPTKWFHKLQCSLAGVYLNVEPGTDCDDIVASLNHVMIKRDVSKPFKNI